MKDVWIDRPMKPSIPLLNHCLDLPTAFSAESLVEAVRIERGIAAELIPQICVLEFDGDLTDWLVSTGKAKLYKPWACFHTKMFSFEVKGFTCGIVSRTIGGPYAVLVAEQMRASGAKIIFGLTSAGRVSPKMPIPGLAIVKEAIRDEGTSYHYLPPSETVKAPLEVLKLLELELQKHQINSRPCLTGTVWTTDAPYRETKKQLLNHAKAGVLAVEMQAASLFAFAKARNFPVGIVAHVTNGIDQTDEPFDKGSETSEFDILEKVCQAGNLFVSHIH